MDRRSKYVSVYTDGSCNGNPGPGGIAVIIKKGRWYKEIVSSIPFSSNNRCELQAVIAGLTAVKVGSHVKVYSDSQYVVDAVNQGRLAHWQGNGWKRMLKGRTMSWFRRESGHFGSFIRKGSSKQIFSAWKTESV